MKTLLAFRPFNLGQQRVAALSSRRGQLKGWPPYPPVNGVLNLTPLESWLVCPRTDTEPQEPGRTDSTQVAGLGNCRALVLVYYPFGRAPVAPYPFVDILTGTPKVSGSTGGGKLRVAWGGRVGLLPDGFDVVRRSTT